MQENVTFELWFRLSRADFGKVKRVPKEKAAMAAAFRDCGLWAFYAAAWA